MDEQQKRVLREILLGFWKVHILHHAAKEGVVGHWMLQELRQHGYDVSPGTLYPLLNRMETNGWLRSEQDKSRGPKSRKRYFLTPEGNKVLQLVIEQAREMCREVSTTPL
ncbi:MAG: helix-turn-helix transcriptional regulator [Magnetococcales bacterium]|nr:helix-turn-helix transcriptional regulator [Magnetococcales bacterium]MBF0115540.1 helix-turn-helix transcriptional regulator [Magnetococcales bacterium]